ncbi:sulfate adenylyltransferase subunit 1 [Corynebacterium urealyticum]|uniref:sulfate adenylyltransferase subunit 1 n=1 Tax=Corynebacterium urealyticum TaxID=43771 RepID=UPI00293E2DF4|nr:GTP-binding protein [Corynebacterium urealyticum]WOH94201.1 GTP-binding protein [Corynebacterium urealyticum]
MTAPTTLTESTTTTGAEKASATTATSYEEAPTLRLCTAGSVDDGKSTFVGRLLHDTKSILADQLESVERVSAARGLRNPDLSLLVDGLRAEREQGITIDVAYRYFASDRRSFILADTPGHVQYTRNTVTGMSTSDLVVILVDVRNGVIEQTRRHLTVAALLDIPQVVVAVNKIDAVDYSQEAFETAAGQVRELVDELRGAFGEGKLPVVDIVPISALVGDNVVSKSENTPWYEGESVLTILEDARPAGVATEEFRFPVQFVIRDHATDYRGYAGRITSGEVAVGDTVHAGFRSSRVAGIDTPDGPQQRATAGQSVTLRLEDELDISRGSILSDETLAEPVTQFSALAFHLADAPVRVGSNLLLRYGPAEVRARVLGIDEQLSIADGAAAEAGEAGDPATALEQNDVARIRVAVADPLSVEPYVRGGQTGSFLLINPSTGDTLTAGLVSS